MTLEPNATARELFYRKLVRRSLWALGCSGVLNIFAFAYIAMEFEEGSIPFLGTVTFTSAKSVVLPFDSPQLLTLQGELVALQNEPFESLIQHLQDATPLTEGYKRQDLALSLLVTSHHFNLAKALPGVKLTKRSVKIGSHPLYLFPGVSSNEFLQIQEFVETERYPFTFQGIYTKLKSDPTSTAFHEACKEMREYQEIERLLVHDGKITQEEAFQFIVAADYAALMKLREQGSLAGRAQFLLAVLPILPKEAAVALVNSEYRFALHHVDDPLAITLLRQLPPESSQAKEYALGLLVSPRSEAVWKEAENYLCQREKLDTAKTTRSVLLAHFGIAKPKAVQKQLTTKKPKPVVAATKPQTALAPAPVTERPKKVVPVPAAKKPEIVHIVKAGDTLWALSKKYKVDVVLIKKHNHLKSDALQPGTALRIPLQK